MMPASLFDSSSSQRLAHNDFGWITTVRHDGQPQSSYVWFHFNGTDIYVISEPQSGKVRNIAGHDRVSFHLDGDGTIGDGVLTVDGTATLAPVTEDPARLSDYMTKYANRIRDGLESTPQRYAATFSIAVRITPKSIRAW